MSLIGKLYSTGHKASVLKYCFDMLQMKFLLFQRFLFREEWKYYKNLTYSRRMTYVWLRCQKYNFRKVQYKDYWIRHWEDWHLPPAQWQTKGVTQGRSTLLVPETPHLAKERFGPENFRALKILRFYNSSRYSGILFTALFLLNYLGYIIHTKTISLKYDEHWNNTLKLFCNSQKKNSVERII